MKGVKIEKEEKYITATHGYKKNNTARLHQVTKYHPGPVIAGS